MVTQTGILGRTKPGYTPLVTLLLPPRVKTCLDAAGAFCSVNGNLTPPPPNATSANTTSGRIPAGTYHVEITYDMGSGNESAPSASQTVTTVDGNSQNSQITISSPPAAPGATGWYAYVTGTNGTRYTLQGGGSTPIGTDLTLDYADEHRHAAPRRHGVLLLPLSGQRRRHRGRVRRAALVGGNRVRRA